MLGSIKPKLVDFRFPITQASEVKQMQEKLYVDGLSHYFDVTLIEEDCNFQAVCDRTNPDLAIFESGKALLHRRIKIEGAKNENSSHNENCWGLLGGLALF